MGWNADRVSVGVRAGDPGCHDAALAGARSQALAAAVCHREVEWGWEDPQPVGETMCFTIYCYQRNGQPYPICDTDDLTVHITHATRKIAAVVELGSGEAALAHTARVKFTVRLAGLYVIAVMIGGVAAAGGPFRRWFVAGGVAARRSRVGRQHALVCAATRARPLLVHPRDHYDNPATLAGDAAKGFSIEIKPVDETEEDLSDVAQFEYDSVNQRVSVSLCFPRPGVYRAAIYYNGEILHNGHFDCIVLTPSDAATVQRQLSSKRTSITYEARLIAASRTRQANDAPATTKQRRVLCCLSPKQLVIKDYLFKIIPKRISSFRVCPSTKLVLCPRAAGGAPGGSLVLEDGLQPPLTLQEFLYSEVRARHSRFSHERVPLRVRRRGLGRRAARVVLAGVQRAVRRALRPVRVFAGKIVGKCLYESALGGSYRQLVRARLARSFRALVIGLRVQYKYFEQDDPELYLSKIKYILETDLDAQEAAPEIYFSDDVYDSQGKFIETHDLIPNGSTIRVTNENKMQYLDALAQWRLAGRWRTQTDAFLRGLNLLSFTNEERARLLHCVSRTTSPTSRWCMHYCGPSTRAARGSG
ncbi:unnamed protein product [Leptidea sinapis]|uniref:HECT-type E3 ubiquitin transferase n=1 Tax=Leptidea sinapis TaxID=189913 RepID=A0A5E4R065_9NEOP|nr:unnamed protein product [Leptidea sinapis]